MEYRRAGWFTGLLFLITCVGDGFSGRPLGIWHQLVVLPLTLIFILVCSKFFFGDRANPRQSLWSPQRALRLALFFQLIATGIYFYECRHYAAMGYHLLPLLVVPVFTGLFFSLACITFSRRASGWSIFVVTSSCYVGGVLLAILSFPLSYLRSDMLPVILWADTNLLHGISPYTTMYVGARVYDFPYLPGMLVAYLPAVALHVDVRFVCLICVVATAALIYKAARPDRRIEVASLLALLLTSPYLQYRHELYNQPQWLTVAAAFFLMQRRHFLWAALSLGVGMAIYQFSWIIFPFVVLNASRRGGWKEAVKVGTVGLAAALAITGPFLRSASQRIASNTVSQWSLRAHADAQPINLSYWVTYVLRPNQLLPLQALMMAAIFLYCIATKRCATLADTLRWTLVALTLFILLNVLVDGYFYLMLLVPLLIYTCVANSWWSEPEQLAALG